MADSLWELLQPALGASSSEHPRSQSPSEVTIRYLNRLSTLPLSSLSSTETESLAQSRHSNNLSLQALSARSNNALVTSSNHLSSLKPGLRQLISETETLKNDVPALDRQALEFSERYTRSAENDFLERRKRSLLMARNVDRLSDVLDLPILLSSTIASSTSLGPSNASNYASALDLHSHIKRLYLLHQQSDIIASIYKQTEDAMQEMTSNLIASLKSQNIKMAAGMRTIGWIRRIAPELDGSSKDSEGNLGALFLVCRLATLVSMLSALEPLRDLADQETVLKKRNVKHGEPYPAKMNWSLGQQTERYLKRYIEIFREQSFAIVSMYKSIFPSAPDSSLTDGMASKLKTIGANSVPSSRQKPVNHDDNALNLRPSALATFPLHLVDLLSTTLQQYLPNVSDQSAKESLLTQVLYCAGSLGRLGGDFSMLLSSMSSSGATDDGDNDEPEDDMGWVNVMKKHRVLASKLEKMASGTS